MTEPSALAAQIIARARDAWTNNPETEGDADAFDHHISTVGVQAHGELYNEAYALANEPHGHAAPGAGEAALAERKERARALFNDVLPELEAYAADCRAAQYTGWSSQSNGPIHRVR